MFELILLMLYIARITKKFFEMKEKILAELRKKYEGQATTKFLENLAERLASKVEKEEDIQGVLDELEKSPITVGDLQAEGDRRATELQTKFTKTKSEIEAEKQAIKDELEGLKNKAPGPKKEKDDDRVKQLEDRLLAFEQKEKEREVRGELESRAKAKRIPSALVKRVKIESVDEIDNVISDLEKEAQEIRQAWINEGVVGKAPGKSDGDPGNDEQIKSDIEEYSKNIK